MNSILEKYPDYELNIGIEVHVQLNTKSKIFCQCSNAVIKDQNVNICEICAGYPGTLPVINKQVVESAILAGLATKSHIASSSTFARKHYFYPDLPKGYQTTQSDQPICENGKVTIRLEDGRKKDIRLIRIHMEEDAGKNTHAASNESFVDLNRAGTPLLEIVSHPDIKSTYEAKEYLKTLHNIVKYIRISSGNMEEGAFRADTNISVKKKSAKELGTRCELKNINSFKFIGDAIEYEIERQIEALEEGKKIIQETRLWDTKNKETIAMRSKEDAADYRYFQCPDLPLLEISPEWVDRVASNLPELPEQKLERLIKDFGLSTYEADILVNDIEAANFFEETNNEYQSKSTINWILRDLLGYLKEKKKTLSEVKISPIRLAKIIELVETDKINNLAAKEVFEAVAETGADPLDVVKEKGLEQIDSTDELEKIVDEIIANNLAQVEQYKSGKDKIFGFFVGQAMQQTKGKGNPKVLQDLLRKKLK